MQTRKRVDIYTDGSCLKNPGKGGYGIVIEYKDTIKELSQGYTRTTNNRMELLGVIVALNTLSEPCIADIYTDSQYVSKAIKEHWLKNWQKNGWKTANKKDVKNKDLWMELHKALLKHTVNFHWVKGHAGHPQNERCDELARTAANSSLEAMLDDTGYAE